MANVRYVSSLTTVVQELLLCPLIRKENDSKRDWAVCQRIAPIDLPSAVPSNKEINLHLITLKV